MINRPGLEIEFLDEALFNHLRDGAQVLEADAFGEKVLRLTDGTFLKIFRRKRLLSSAAFRPYSVRFVRNAQKLKKLGIICPTPVHLYKLIQPGLWAVHYHPVPGEPLRTALETLRERERADILYSLGKYVAELHARGIYFRSLHFGNIILCPDRRLGLIDISDLKFFASPLNENRRKRNLKHLTRIQTDRIWILDDHQNSFFEGYAEKRPPS